MENNLHPECFHSYALRRIDRLYAKADDPNTPKSQAMHILDEIKYLSNQIKSDHKS